MTYTATHKTPAHTTAAANNTRRDGLLLFFLNVIEEAAGATEAPRDVSKTGDEGAQGNRALPEWSMTA